MIAAILDTNVIVQSLIGSPRSASVRTLEAYYDGHFRLIYCAATLDELLDVLMLPRMLDRHGLSDNDLLDFVASLLVYAERHAGTHRVSKELARDGTDTKFLSLAVESDAD